MASANDEPLTSTLLRSLPGLGYRKHSSGELYLAGSVSDAGNPSGGLDRIRRSSTTRSKSGGLSKIRGPTLQPQSLSARIPSARDSTTRDKESPINREIDASQGNFQMLDDDKQEIMTRKHSSDGSALSVGARIIPGMIEEGRTLSRDEKSKVLKAKQRLFRRIKKRSVFDEQGYQEDPKVPYVVSCGIMVRLLRLAEFGMTGFIRECCMGALCNLARKTWIDDEVLKDVCLLKTLLKGIRASLTRAEEGTPALAAKGVWNVISRMVQDRLFMDDCVQSGVVGSLCGAAKGAADLLMATDESADDVNVEGAVATDEEGDRVFRQQMRQTIKACLKTLHAFIKHAWVRSSPPVLGIRKDLLTALVTCGVSSTEAAETAMATMCNLTSDVCCDLDMLEEAGALQHIFSQAFCENRVVLTHVAGTLANLASVLEPIATGSRAFDPKELTIFDVVVRLANFDDQRLAFRTSAFLYGLTRKRDCVKILSDLRGLSDIIFKIFRSGVFYTQSYCLQALFNLTRNREFAKTIVDHDLMEDFIVASMVHSNGARIKELSSQVLFYLISNPSTRTAVLRCQGLWTLVQLATVSRSSTSMQFALLALFNLACDLRGNSRWLDEHALAAVMEFDDEVLGAPAYPGLLYLASTQNGRLSEILVSTRVAREAIAKIEGAKFLKRDRALEEDEKSMARATSVVIPASVRLEDSSFDEDDLSRDTLEDVMGKRSRLRSSFVATHLLPTLSTVYNLCCKSAKAARLFLREGIVEYIASLLAEMRATEERSRYHPQVETMCAAVLSCMIDDVALVPKLIESRVTISIVQGLRSRFVPVRLVSLWSLLMLSIPTTETRPSSSSDHRSRSELRMWMLMCRQAVVQCKAVSALWTLWEDMKASLDSEASKNVRFAIATVLQVFLMDPTVAVAVVQQRGAELAAIMMMGSTDASTTELSLLSFPENESNLDERSNAISKVATISCAVPTVYLPGIPVGSVCEGCLRVFLGVLPTHEENVRDLCSLAMRGLVGNEDLLQDLIMEPRFTDVLKLLLQDATPIGKAHIRDILQRVVVLSSAPGIADLSPTLLDLTDCVFQRKEAEVSSSKFSAVDGTDVAGARPCQGYNVWLSARRTVSVRAGINASYGGVGAAVGRKDRGKKCETGPICMATTTEKKIAKNVCSVLQQGSNSPDRLLSSPAAASPVGSAPRLERQSRLAFARAQRMIRAMRLRTARCDMLHEVPCS
ncbi:unnamed protein product [Ascophyllum nodosum]